MYANITGCALKFVWTKTVYWSIGIGMYVQSKKYQ